MGRSVHQRGKTVPAANREPEKAGLGYSEAAPAGGGVFGDGIKDVQRSLPNSRAVCPALQTWLS